MDISIRPFTEQEIGDVLVFERTLRVQEDDWNWAIDDAYQQAVTNSFHDKRFQDSISLLAYDGGLVVGRIDTTIIASHFDGSVKAYLDWICVLKSHRHKGVAQMLMDSVRAALKNAGATCMVALIAQNDEAQRFYRSMTGAKIRDEGIWIEL